jgi:hypothetical protein
MTHRQEVPVNHHQEVPVNHRQEVPVNHHQKLPVNHHQKLPMNHHQEALMPTAPHDRVSSVPPYSGEIKIPSSFCFQLNLVQRAVLRQYDQRVEVLSPGVGCNAQHGTTTHVRGEILTSMCTRLEHEMMLLTTSTARGIHHRLKKEKQRKAALAAHRQPRSGPKNEILGTAARPDLKATKRHGRTSCSSHVFT